MSSSGKPLRILLIDEFPERTVLLDEALTVAGHDVMAWLPSSSGLREEVVRVQPDAIIVDVDSPSRDLLDGLRLIHQEMPRPIVMFTHDSDSTTIRKAVRAGVSAYVVDGLSRERVIPILEVAIARFEEFQALRQELEQTKLTLQERKLIERAKGVVMKQRRLDEEEAYRAMRKMAMDRNVRVAELAKSIIAAAELLS